MNLGSQSISNESQTFNDYRYQKALKQISKLINVNRQIKIESENCKSEHEEITHKNSQLLEINSSLEQQNQLLRNQLQAININYAQLEDFCKKAEYEQKQLLRENEVESMQKLEIEQKHHAEIEEIESHFREQMNQMMMEIHGRDSTINDLQQKLQYINQLQAQNDKLHQSYQMALKQNAELSRKTQQLNEQLITASSKIKQEPNQDLINKLRINEEWIKSLNQQNYNLKQKVFEQEYKKQREKCNETILRNVRDTASLMNATSSNANQFLIKEYQKQVQKKIKKLEEEKQKVQHKYSKLKIKYQELEAKSISFEKQGNLLTIKLSGYEQLAERQQHQIQQMIQEYHLQMDKVISNKKKIHSSHNIQQPDQVNQQSQRQNELKILVQNLESQIIQYQAQSQEKDMFIDYLQGNIQALENKRMQIQKVNSQLEQYVCQNQNMDLNKTSKNYNKPESFAKFQTPPNNGGKVFNINGKKYESQLLKNKDTIQSRQECEQIYADQGVIKTHAQPNQQTKLIYPHEQISYTSSQRSYGNQMHFLNVQRA